MKTSGIYFAQEISDLLGNSRGKMQKTFSVRKVLAQTGLKI